MTVTENNPATLNGDEAQPCIVQQSKPGDIAAQQQQIFLNTLSVEGDIKAAALAAGHDDDAAFFRLKQTSVAFSAEWDAAIDIAYQRLESSLLSGALRAAAAAVTQTGARGDLRSLATWHRLGLSLLAAHRVARGRIKGHAPGMMSNAKGALLNKLNHMREKIDMKNTDLAVNG